MTLCNEHSLTHMFVVQSNRCEKRRDACRGDVMRDDSNVDCAINFFFNICFVAQLNDVISLSVESKNVNKLEL